MMLKVAYKILHHLLFFTLFFFVSITCHPVGKPSEIAHKTGQGEAVDDSGNTKAIWELPMVKRSSKGTNNMPSWMHGLAYPFDKGYHNPSLETKIDHITEMLQQNSAQATVQKGSEVQEQPTFSPIISTRVFSMTQFLNQIKHNLESMTDEEDYSSVETEINERDLEQEILAGSLDKGLKLTQHAEPNVSWYSNPTTKDKRLIKLQNFVDNNQPYKHGYKFGLG